MLYLAIQGKITSNCNSVIPQVTIPDEFKDNPHILTQFVCVSRTTDKKGQIISAILQKT